MKKTVIVKLGTSIATTQRGRLDMFRMDSFAKQIKLLHENGIGVILVVSAAVSCGQRLMHTKIANELEKQVLAGIGQAYAISSIYTVFKKMGIHVAQLLLSNTDLVDDTAKKRIYEVIEIALQKQIVIIANENDIVSLNSFGGNDFLAVSLTQLMSASHLLLLTDVEGIYDYQMKIIQLLSGDIKLADIKKKHSGVVVGGITGKIQAAKHAANYGTQTYITNGKTKDIILRIVLNNEDVGTKVTGGVL